MLVVRLDRIRRGDKKQFVSYNERVMSRKLIATIAMLGVLLATFLPLVPAAAMDFNDTIPVTLTADGGHDCPGMQSDCCDDKVCASICILHGFQSLAASPNAPFFEDAPLAITVASSLMSLVRGPDVRPPIA